MTKIIVNGPDGRLEHEVELAPNEGLLIGRSPNLASLSVDPTTALRDA